ncbi:MAG TPA: hypothetical protein PKM50_09100 [Methanoregula sp.]|nr:hypothetical protein [Methanoregula sp.]
MAVDFEPNTPSAQRSRIVLSTKTKNRIKEIVGKCEYCDAEKSPESLEIHILGMLSRSPHRPNDYPANVIIVLCKEHHHQVSTGKITKSTLKSRISKRPDKVKRALRTLLEKHDRTYEGETVNVAHNPDWFGAAEMLEREAKRRR